MSLCTLTNTQPPQPIELRSDTYTQPTPAMRRAIAEAICGDDMVGEDPTVNRLEQQVADLLGKEAAVYACSGTQSNQMAVWTHCTSGDELLIEATGHIANYEAGGPAALSGVSVRRIIGSGGMLSLADLEAAWRGPNLHFAPTRLLCLENSTNLGGGQTYPWQQLVELCDWAQLQGLKTHLDGARLFNACIAQGYHAAEVARCFDTISICFSKGLGCPMGSILVGSAIEIARARRARKLFGGALRQAGIVAAAAIYALDHHVERLAEDHANARFFATGVSQIDGLTVDLTKVETNLVFFEVDRSWGTAAQLSQALRAQGVLINPAGGSHRLRACTHLDVSQQDIQVSLEVLEKTIQFGTELPSTARVAAYD